MPASQVSLATRHCNQVLRDLLSAGFPPGAISKVRYDPHVNGVCSLSSLARKGVHVVLEAWSSHVFVSEIISFDFTTDDLFTVDRQ